MDQLQDFFSDPGIAAGIVALIGALLSSFVSYLTSRRRRNRTDTALQLAQETDEHRIERLAASLKEAVALINQIEAEISTGLERATKLQEEIAAYEQAAKLTKEQTTAVRGLLDTALEQSQRKSFWQGFAVNFGFFIAGVIVSVALLFVAPR